MSARRQGRVEIYKSEDGWRWRFKRNGKVRADGGQGYSRHIDCIAGMCDVLAVIDVEDDQLYRSTWNGQEFLRLVDEAAP